MNRDVDAVCVFVCVVVNKRNKMKQIIFGTVFISCGTILKLKTSKINTHTKCFLLCFPKTTKIHENCKSTTDCESYTQKKK